ncbi:PIN domain-containing protein [Polaribacter sp. Asnod1-A03]|uniref:PIN domain-containing protein n=1 Tax=Polaribacter sp. Asnod1-A03 TaxID=3160581 RepID=UPI00386529CD
MAENKDIFYLDKVYPEPDKIFSETFSGANKLLKDSIIILDTNVLLIPFDTNDKNLQEIKNIFLKYKSKNRLFIPARVAREFANNRATKIGDVFLQVRQTKEKLNSGNFKINQYPILEKNKDYIELKKQFEDIQKLIKLSRKNLENIESHIREWTWNDNVSIAYKEIFTPEIIIEVKKDVTEIEKDLAFRIAYKIAPGFKDSKKPDDGVGDLIIWQTILEIAKEHNKNVVFVTNDQKNDWFYKQDKIGLYPKYELFDEFRRYTSGKSISIINFIKFLELSDADAETINEVKTSIKEKIKEYSKIDVSSIVEGLEVEHNRFGKGQVKKVWKDGSFKKAKISFEHYGNKTLLLQFAKIKILDNEWNYLIQNPDFNEDDKNLFNDE